MKIWRRTVSIALAMTMATVAFSGKFFASDENLPVTNLSVDFNNIIQNDFLGANAVYHGYMFQPDNEGREYTMKQAKKELDRVSAMGIKIVRTYYDTDFAWNNDEWDWESPKMQGFYFWLDEMKARGIEVALNAGWSCPSSINSTTGWPLKKSPLDTGDWKTSVDKYAEWVSESLHQMIVKRGYTNIKYLCMFTEAQRTSGKLTSGGTQYEAWLDCVKACDARLRTDGLRDRVKMVGPNEGSTTTSQMVEWAVKNASDYIDIFSSHNYDAIGSTLDTYYDWCTWAKTGMDFVKKSGKQFWFDEYGTFNEDMRFNDARFGTNIGLAQAAFLNTGVQTSMIWTLFDQQWPSNNSTNSDSFYNGVHKHGLAPTLMESEIPRKSYYAFSIISKYMGGKGTKVVQTKDALGVHIAATRLPDGNVSILVVNSNYDTHNISIQFSEKLNRSVYRHIYDPSTVKPNADAKVPGADKTFTKVGNTIADSIPAGGVAVYTTVADYSEDIPNMIDFTTDKNVVDAPEHNLISNGNAEMLPQDGTSWNVDSFLKSGAVSVEETQNMAFEGTKYFKVTAAEAKTAVFTIPVKPYTNYMFSAAVKGELHGEQQNGAMSFGVADPKNGKHVRFLNTSYAEYDHEKENLTDSKSMTPPSWDGQWHRRGCVFNSGALKEVQIKVNYLAGTAYLDDLILCEEQYARSEKGEDKAPMQVTDTNPNNKGCAEQYNQFKNASFTEISDTFWNPASFLQIIADPGNKKNNVLKFTSDMQTKGMTYIKWISVKPHTNYTFTALAKGDVETTAAFGLTDSNSVLPQTVGTEIVPNAGEWKIYSFSFDTGDHDKIGFFVSNANGSFMLDDLKLFESTYGEELKTPDFVNPGTDSMVPVGVVAILLVISGLMLYYVRKRRAETTV